jgi:hypothetical protein
VIAQIKAREQAQADAEAAANPGQRVTINYTIDCEAEVGIEAMADYQAEVNQDVKAEQAEQGTADQAAAAQGTSGPCTVTAAAGSGLITLLADDGCPRVIGSVNDIFDNLDDNVYMHYTNQDGYEGILRDDEVVLKANQSGQVFATQEMQSPAEAEQNLFIGNPEYAGKGDYVVIFKSPPGVTWEPPGGPLNEVVSQGTVRVPVADVIYAGPNPFE